MAMLHESRDWVVTSLLYVSSHNGSSLDGHRGAGDYGSDGSPANIRWRRDITTSFRLLPPTSCLFLSPPYCGLRVRIINFANL